jgi:hypothetical protein
MLRSYLVADVEDPRLNVQSVLSRHFVAHALFGDRFAALQEQELRFGAVLNWLKGWLKEAVGPEDFATLRHALRQGADNAEGFEIPRFVSEAYAGLPVQADGMVIPNHLDCLLARPGGVGFAGGAGSTGHPAARAEARLPEEVLMTFQSLWHAAVRDEASQAIRVLEPACGSANDYRFLHGFGLARLIRYTGFDLCDKNVANARALFPDTEFRVGNVLEIEAPDRVFDLCLVHDLFEHLSPEAMAQAVTEVCRVTRHGLCFGFFNMHEGPEPIVRKVEDYHRNTLSVPATRSLVERHGFSVQVVHIGTFLKWRFAGATTHNDNAYTFLCSAKGPERQS